MERKHITYNRKTLYKEVWKEPMTTVSKRYGISDVALKKVCRKLQIPTPWNGYWSQAKSVNNIKIPPLPHYDGPQEITTTHNEFSDDEKRIMKERNRERKSQVSPYYERVKSAYMSVANDTGAINNYHKFVFITEKALKKQETRLNNPFKRAFGIIVTDSSQERALKLANILYRTILKLKYKIDFCHLDIKSNTYAVIEGEYVLIRIKEFAQQIDHMLTPEEKRDKTGYGIPKYDFHPTGELALVIEGPYARKYIFRDSNINTVENCIVEFIMKLIDIAYCIKQNREEEKIRNEQYEQRKIAYDENERLKREELDRFKKLEEAAMDWYHAQIIKDYVLSIEMKMKLSRLSLEDRFKRKKWVKWAKDKADWLNPLVNKEDPILGKKRE